jgi:hypothetical protein
MTTNGANRQASAALELLIFKNSLRALSEVVETWRSLEAPNLSYRCRGTPHDFLHFTDVGGAHMDRLIERGILAHGERAPLLAPAISRS